MGQQIDVQESRPSAIPIGEGPDGHPGTGADWTIEGRTSATEQSHASLSRSQGAQAARPCAPILRKEVVTWRVLGERLTEGDEQAALSQAERVASSAAQVRRHAVAQRLFTRRFLAVLSELVGGAGIAEDRGATCRDELVGRDGRSAHLPEQSTPRG